ncbi:MAG: FKBP-type peptidyl-prolyl cis-trans isomerase [Bacteroidetes bacterium]|nr:FKBP-type peptidyl-prolyl cis-trans isomerase [Bacteroidota bacterium]
MHRFFQFSILLLSAIFATGCLDDPVTPQEQFEKDIEKIQEYLADNNLTADSTASGLHYITEVEGTGGHPTIDDDVTVFYKGYYLDGKVFDQTGTDPVTFPLKNVIFGWQEGIPLFQKGGKGKLFLPSGLAYGPTPPPGVRKNAVMIFEVELVDF